MTQPFRLATAGLLAGSLLGPGAAFTTPLAPRAASPLPRSRPALAASAPSTATDLVVISPPGGVGEIASVEAARLGGSVKWFVVSAAASPPGDGAALTAETLAAIERAGGSMELAGASADDLLTPPGDSAGGALASIGSWVGGAGSAASLVCAYDGAAEEARRASRARSPAQNERAAGMDDEGMIRGGVRAAARAAAGSGGTKVAVLAAGEEAGDEAEEEGGAGGFLAGLFGGSEWKVPATMDEALGGATAVVRHGELFGAAESSPESSPFAGGPRRDPTVREMYTLRSVRVDPAASADASTRSNRLEVGTAASRLGLGRIASAAGETVRVSLASYAGTDAPSEEEWEAEFSRAAEASAASRGEGALFRADFASVPSPSRLAEWLAVKWAPAVLRSYDIAGTRVGARPVYALQTGDDGTTVEIAWQELVNFESVTSGKMIVKVDDKGMTATRGAGDASKGFGRISSVPLPGEDILVRRLADAASQAVEKGLAEKPKVAKKEEKKLEKPATTLVAPQAAAPVQPAPETGASGPGPRGAGARRSAERTRGKRRKSSPPPSASSSESD